MRKIGTRAIALVLMAILLAGAPASPSAAGKDAADTPLAQHGKLSVKGTNIIDKNGKPFQLRGISTHGINWDVGKPYVNKEAFRTLRDEWGVNAVRLAMYTMEYNGYCSGGDRKDLKSIIDNGVTYATDLGLYVIIDWHILSDGSPLKNKDQAKVFFGEMSKKYKDYSNVIYEICNEPNGCSWSEIKKYANEVIPVIRKNDKDAIIIVGTPTWSQLGIQGHTNEVVDYPLTGYTNLVFSLHFYASESAHSQYLPKKLAYALKKGLPVIVSEFGLSEASGSGKVDKEMAKTWLNTLDKNNISYFCWSLSNKNETSALLSPKTDKKSGWTDKDLSEAGKWIKTYYRARAAALAKS